MADITVKASDGVSVLYTIKTDSDGKVTDVTKPTGAVAGDIDVAQMKNLLMGADLGAKTDDTWKLDQIFEKLGQVSKTGENVDVDKTLERLKTLGKDVQDLKAMIAVEKAKTPVTAAITAKIDKLQSILNVANAQLKGLYAQIKDKISDSVQQGKLDSVTANHSDLETAAPSAGKASSAPGSQSSPQASSAPPTPPYPTQGKASGLPGAGQFDLNKILQSSMFQGINQDSLATMGKNQMDQKKMMMLFMYFAMMAMSGDVGAMTSFMQFITTMITKDKAMQNVNMANKLIELEDASRKATDELLNTPSYDPNNQQVGADFSKTMEKVKADQGSIATSQKLIAQMMEEFAQVSEFLNNLQKSLLDVRGRILSRVSSFNA